MLRQVKELRLALVDLLKADAIALFALDDAEFVSVIKECIPEVNFMQSKANETAEALGNNNQPKKDFHGFTEVEGIKAIAGLLCFKYVMNSKKEDYDRFVACQIEMKKPVLSFESFQAIGKYVISKLKTDEDYAAAMWSILCNDLGKVHKVISIHEEAFGKKNIGHDALLAEVIVRRPEMFQGFYNLPAEYQARIMRGYASGCDISMLEQLELSVEALRGLSGLDEKTLDLYYVHTIFDVAGAAAPFRSNGSLTMHQETWNFFSTLEGQVKKLLKGSTIEDVYADYLRYRGECVGIENTSAERTALIRIAGMSRLATPEQGRLLLTTWNQLDVSIRNTLVKELNVHGGMGERAIFIGYSVAMLLNPQGALKKELGEQNAVIEGLKVGLTIMARAFVKAREIIANDASTALYVAECAEVAKLLSKEPREKLAMEFVVIKGKENDGRRVDFNLVLPQLENKAVISAHVANSVFASVANLTPPAPVAPAVPKL